MSNQKPEFKISTGCSTFCVHCANKCDERMVEYDPNTTAQDRINDQKIAEQNAIAEDRMYAEQTRLAIEESDRHKAELIAGLKECERIATEEKRPEDATAWKVIRDILESEGVMYGDNIEKMNAELSRIAKKHLNAPVDHCPKCNNVLFATDPETGEVFCLNCHKTIKPGNKVVEEAQAIRETVESVNNSGCDVEVEDDSDAIQEAERRMGANGTDEYRRDITGKNDLSPDFYGDDEGADEGE